MANPLIWNCWHFISTVSHKALVLYWFCIGFNEILMWIRTQIDLFEALPETIGKTYPEHWIVDMFAADLGQSIMKGLDHPVRRSKHERNHCFYCVLCRVQRKSSGLTLLLLSTKKHRFYSGLAWGSTKRLWCSVFLCRVQQKAMVLHWFCLWFRHWFHNDLV